MSIVSSTAWRSSSAVPGDTVAVAEISYGDETKVIRIATRDIVIGGRKFLGILKVFPEISYGLSLRSNEYTIANTQLSILNLEYEPGKRYSDLFTELGEGSDIGLENRRVDIRLWREGITTFNDCLQLFPNGISRKPVSGRKNVLQDAEDLTELNLRKIFTDLVNDSDATTGYTLPQGSKGKTKPIVYGDHRFLINQNDLQSTTDEDDWVGNLEQNLTPMIHLGGDEWLIAGHQINGASEAAMKNDGDSVWGFDTRISRYVELQVVDWTLVQNTSAGAIVRRTGHTYYDYRLPVSASGAFTNDSNMVDRDVDTAATMATTGAGTNDETIVFPTNDIDADGSTGEFTAGKLFIVAQDTLGSWFGDPLKADLYVNNTPADRWTVEPLNAFATHSNPIGLNDLDLVALTFENVDGGNYNLSVFECYLRVEYDTAVDVFLDLYWGGKGKNYDTWIDSRPNHADFAAGSGTLIRNPAGSEESILRLGASLGDDDIDTDAFDTASNSLSSLNADLAFTNPVTAKKVLADFGKQFRSYSWYQTNKTIKMQVIEDTYLVSGRRVRYRDILKLSFPENDYDLLVTKNQVLYNWDGKTFQSRTSFAQDTTAQTKYNVDGDQTRRILQSPFIHSDATAESIRDFFLDQWKNIHNIAIVTVDAIHLDLDIGDIVRLDDIPYEANGIDISKNDTKAGQTIYPFWFIYNIRRSNTLTFKAIQLHDLTT